MSGSKGCCLLLLLALVPGCRDAVSPSAPTPSPTQQPTAVPSPDSTSTPTAPPTPSATSTVPPTSSPTVTPGPTPTATSSPTVTPGPTPTATSSPTVTPGHTPSPSPSPPLNPLAPPIPSYSEGVCPLLLGGPTKATAVVTGFLSSGISRKFRLLIPPSYDGSTPYPVVFAWHWLNASSGSFVDDGELESATEDMGFIAVLPDDKEDANGNKAYLFNWPFAEFWGQEEELIFFDDLLSCVDANFNIDPQRVYGIGVSAGALWLTYLSMTSRIKHFAAIESLSGGLGEVPFVWSIPYQTPEKTLPVIALDGGPFDWLGLDFYNATINYRDALLNDGHFVVYCEHDQGHAMPPITPPVPGMTKFYSLWRFMLDHPYTLPPGTSPYQLTGLPPEFPPWCSIAGP